MARRSATRSCRWRSSNPSWRSSTRPTRGLDIDALRIVAKGIREIRVDRPEMGVVLITHYQRLLDELQPDQVHIMVGGSHRGQRRHGAGRPNWNGRDTRRSPMSDRLDVARDQGPVPAAAARAERVTPLVYLDSANTAAEAPCRDRRDDPVHGALLRPHQPQRLPLAAEATDAFEGARTKVQRFVNARRDHEDHLHQERHRVAEPRRLRLGPRQPASGDVVVLTQMEHHANIVPVAHARRAVSGGGIELRWVPLTTDGQLDLTDLPPLLDGAKVFSFTAMSNVLGTITPVKQLCDAAHAAGAVADRRRLPVRAAQRHRRAGVGRRLRSPSAATSCAARRASACCGAARPCSTRCRRSWAAAT